ncbi:MAG: radical SAM family heme chaperone HemW [Clostridia bacterium]|nr:radical SAM family heme chaperone HemW [Clostridia bacterium]
MKKLGVYVHIPFCLSRCAYCDFISSVLTDDSQLNTYVEHIIKEIGLLKESGVFSEREIDTIYFGGGTPSLLKSAYLRSILEAIRLNKRAVSQEVTIEANPATIDYETLLTYKEAGINRISIGVQSLNDKTLKAIGRRHNAEQALEAIEIAEKTGLSISVDLMLGLPFQTKEDIKFFIDEVLKHDVKHISTYMLSLEDGTKLKAQVEKNEIKVSSDDEKVELFDYASNLLKEKGFIRYEVSNFAKIGFEAKHNSKYWTRGEYIGIGLGAHSLISNERFYNKETFSEYYKDLDEGRLPHVIEATLDESEAEEEYIMLALRTNQGINLADYKAKFNKDFVESHKSGLDLHKDQLNILNNNISIKEEYLNVLNQIVIDLI